MMAMVREADWIAAGLDRLLSGAWTAWRRRPKAGLVCALLTLWMAWGPGSAPVSAQAGSDPAGLDQSPERSERVIHVRVDGAIDVGSQSLVARALREVSPGDTFVIELDTPGGSAEIMHQVSLAIDAVSKREVRTVCWVNRSATSAGAYIAMSCEYLYFVPHATIGSSTPVMMVPGGIAEVPEDMREKLYSSFRSDFRSWAEAHGYPPALAEAMVDAEVEVEKVYIEGEGPRYVTQTDFEALRAVPGREVTRLSTLVPAGELLNMTGSEAVELGFGDGIRETLDELLSKLGLGGAEVVSFEPTRSEELASLLDSVKWLLFGAALFLAYMELKMPGFGLPGGLAIACFALFLFGQYLVGLADFVHILAVVAGVVLIAIELFVMPGAIWPAALGAVLVLGGLAFSLVGSLDSLRYDLGRRILVDDGFQMMLGCFGAVLAGAVASRFLPQTVIGKKLVLQPVGDAFGAALPPAQPDQRARSGAAPGSPGSAGSPSSPSPSSPVRAGALGTTETPLRPVGKVVLADAPRSSFEARSAGDAIEAGERIRVLEVSGGRLLVERLDPDGAEASS